MKKRKHAVCLVHGEDKDGAIVLISNLPKHCATRLCEQLNDVLDDEDEIIDEVYFTVRKRGKHGRL